MITSKKAEALVLYHMDKLLNKDVFDCEKFDSQLQIDRFNDFIMNPNVNTTTSDVNKEYSYIQKFKNL